jgi:hypothetical protein
MMALFPEVIEKTANVMGLSRKRATLQLLAPLASPLLGPLTDSLPDVAALRLAAGSAFLPWLEISRRPSVRLHPGLIQSARGPIGHSSVTNPR